MLVHGAYTAQRAREAGVLDELQIHQIPVLFGGGRRLFHVLASRIELEIVRVSVANRSAKSLLRKKNISSVYQERPSGRQCLRASAASCGPNA